MRTTDKKSISRLVEICRRKNIRKVIFSPGSRNAPLVIAFSADKNFECETIPDERVAAFVALGKSIATALPTIICCTSGSAVLNYAPAIVEAYYQRVPLLVLTADRPGEWIDQGIGQSMRQNGVYANYIKGSFQFLEEAKSDNDLLANDAIVEEAINLSLAGAAGPVHINLPFHEPLYGQEVLSEFHPAISLDRAEDIREFELSEELKKVWSSSNRKLVIAGLIHPNPELKAILTELVKKEEIVLLTETTSNLYVEGSIQCLDRVLAQITEGTAYRPDLLISIGGPIVSKKIKEFLLQHKPKQHWFLDAGALQDTYRAKPIHLDHSPESVLSKLVNIESDNEASFGIAWSDLQSRTSAISTGFLSKSPYSDLTVFEALLHQLPTNSVLHLANSTPIRYAQLFDQRLDLEYYSNRGVSGIDGSTSTAMGFASVNDKLNVLVTGDMSFIYDSNAFWQAKLPANLQIILINNGGGGIFRYIPGPDTTDQLEEVFEAHHSHGGEQFAKMYKLAYSKVDNLSDLKSALTDLWSANSCSIIEVMTPRLLNDKILKEYFSAMKAI